MNRTPEQIAQDIKAARKHQENVEKAIDPDRVAKALSRFNEIFQEHGDEVRHNPPVQDSPAPETPLDELEQILEFAETQDDGVLKILDFIRSYRKILKESVQNPKLVLVYDDQLEAFTYRIEFDPD